MFLYKIYKYSSRFAGRPGWIAAQSTKMHPIRAIGQCTKGHGCYQRRGWIHLLRCHKMDVKDKGRPFYDLTV